MVHSKAIWYDSLTCRESFESNMKQNGAFWAFWDLCSMTLRGYAPDPLVNYLLLFISASDILKCAISWLYETQNVWIEVVSSSSMSRVVDAHPFTPLAFIFIAFWVVYFFYFLEKVEGPGLQGLHIATPVLTDTTWSLKWIMYMYVTYTPVYRIFTKRGQCL